MKSVCHTHPSLKAPALADGVGVPQAEHRGLARVGQRYPSHPWGAPGLLFAGGYLATVEISPQAPILPR